LTGKRGRETKIGKLGPLEKGFPEVEFVKKRVVYAPPTKGRCSREKKQA